ncbi:B3 DNA binding domain [Forsythia ovata]|uniref:B3 DNA binding domain n=1 Tax=Forsythia ovata TaxID=205694 RepID=A0ABD1TCD2_9LAMI
MEFGFLFPNNTNFPVPPVKITSDMQLKWLIELNKRHHTPLCVTLIRREQPMNRPNAANEADDEVRDELYHNCDDFWNTVEIGRDDDVVFPETNATQRPPEIVQDNEEEFPFTNDDLIASVSRSNQAVRPRTVDESACEDFQKECCLLCQQVFPQLYVPGTFARTHLPRFVNEVQIHDAAGRVWQIGLDRRGNGIVRRIERGWAAFYSTKNISPGDTCVFELINSDIPVFNVYTVAAGGRQLL